MGFAPKPCINLRTNWVQRCNQGTCEFLVEIPARVTHLKNSGRFGMSSGSDFDDLWHSLFYTDHCGGDSADGREKNPGPKI